MCLLRSEHFFLYKRVVNGVNVCGEQVALNLCEKRVIGYAVYHRYK